MSRCGRTRLLEELVRGELPQGLEQELRAHSTACARCRHELNWLEAERQLFRQRASRDEVQHLWAGVARRSKSPRPMGRIAVALAASLLFVVATQLAPWPGRLQSSNDASVSAFESEEIQSPSALMDEPGVCSLLPGLGFHCGPAVPASFVATR